MPLICTLDLHPGSAPGWWAWHLAWMLAQQAVGSVVWTELGTTRWTERLMGPLTWETYRAQRRRPAWVEAGALGALRPEPDRDDLRWLPGAEPGGGQSEDVSAIQEAALAAIQAEPDLWWVVDVAQPSLRIWSTLLAQASTTVLVVPTNAHAAKLLAALHDELKPLRNPRYCLVQTPGRMPADERADLECRVRVRFHEVLLEASAPAVTEALADPRCVGRVAEPWNPHSTRLDRLPVFQLPYAATGHGVPEGRIQAARRDWDEVARRVEQSLRPAGRRRPIGIGALPVPEEGPRRALYPAEQTIPPPIGADGFLLNTEGGDGWNPTVRRVVDAERHIVDWRRGRDPHWALLIEGEGGLGKTTLLQELSKTDALPEPIALGGEDRSLTRIATSAQSALVLDGVDEWSGSPQVLVEQVLAWKQRIGASAKVLLAGRPGRALQYLNDQLAGSLHRWLLLPLRRVDARAAAQRWQVADPEALLAEVDRLALGRLAGLPQTFAVLASTWRQERRLPTTRWEALGLLVAQLAGAKDARPEVVLPAAGLLAWTSLLRRQPVIGKNQLDHLDALPYAELARLGATTWLPSPPPSPPSARSARSKELEAALQTSLFIQLHGEGDRGPTAWRFAHQAFAEQLAAGYATDLLRRRGGAYWRLLRRWFFAEDESSPHEHLRGVLSLLAGQRLEVAHELIEHDPIGLMHQGADVPPEARGRWLEALARELSQPGRWLRHVRYVALVDHETPTRTLSLATELLGRSETEVIDLGIEVLAAHARVGVERQDALERLAAAVGSANGWGSRGLAMVRLSELRAKLETLGLAGPDWRRIHAAGLKSDFYRWSVLTALWPAHIGAMEAIDLLRQAPEPGPESEAVLFRVFDGDQGLQLANSLTSTELGAAIRRVPAETWENSYLERCLIRRAWDDLAVDSELAAPLAALLHQHLPDLQYVEADWGLEGDPRRIVLLDALLALMPENEVVEHWHEIASAALRPTPEAMVEQAHAHRAENPGLARRWGLLCLSLNPHDPRVSALIEPLFDLLPELKAWHDAAAQARQDLARAPEPAPRPPRHQPESRASILVRMLESVGQDPLIWRHLFDWLWNCARAAPDALSEEVRRLFGEAAADYLAMPSSMWPSLVERGGVARGELALAWACAPDQRLPEAAELVERLGPAVFHIDGLATRSEVVGIYVPEAWRPQLGDLSALAEAVEALPAERFAERLVQALAWKSSVPSHGTMARWASRRWQDGFATPFLGVLNDESIPEPVREAALSALLQSEAASPHFAAWCQQHALKTWVLRAMISSGRVTEALHAFLALAPANAEAAYQSAAAFGFTGRAAWQAAADGEALTQYCRWLHQCFGDARPVPGVLFSNANFRHEDLRRLRAWLAEAGKVDATAQLDDLPDNASYLALAMRRRRAQTWVRPRLADLVALSPKLETPADLRSILIAALEALQAEDLDGPTSVNGFFFNGEGRINEVAACQLLGNLLRHQLRALGVQVDPKFEVQQHQAADRVDLQVSISVPSTHGLDGVLTHIEVKWVDHKDARGKALAEQAARYQSRDPHRSTAIYLVLWYPRADGPHARWRDSIAAVRDDLEAEAEALPAPDGIRPVEPFVLRLEPPKTKTAVEPAVVELTCRTAGAVEPTAMEPGPPEA